MGERKESCAKGSSVLIEVEPSFDSLLLAALSLSSMFSRFLSLSLSFYISPLSCAIYNIKGDRSYSHTCTRYASTYHHVCVEISIFIFNKKNYASIRGLRNVQERKFRVRVA